MKYSVLLAAALGSAVLVPALAAQDAPGVPAPARVHEVRRGDTLWDLARRYLNDPFLWPEIYRINADIIRDPARIFPSNRLRIPRLGDGDYAGELFEPDRTIFFPRERGPAGPTHLIRAPGTADVPVLARGVFYRAAFLAPDRDLSAMGRLTHRVSPTVVPVELPANILLYDRVLIELAPGAQTSAGESLQLFRRARAVRGYGRVWEPTALATVESVEGRVATAVIMQLFEAATIGDLAFPAEEFPVPPGVSPQSAEGVSGRIVAFRNQHPIQLTQEIAFLDLGARSGVAAGDEFIAYLPPQRTRREERPEVEVARLQVVRVMQQTASARIVELYHPALEPGVAVRLVRKMP